MSKRKSTPDVMSQLQGLGGVLPQRPEARPSLPTPPAKETAVSRRPKNKTPRSRLVGRATYDIGQELKEALRHESIELGVPASQLAKYLLLYAWDFYLKEEIPPPPLLRSDSPKFRNTIDFGE